MRELRRGILLAAFLVAGCGGGGTDAADVAGGRDTGGGDAVAADAEEDTGPDPTCAGAALFTPCDDGNPCTEDDQCLDGKCVGAVRACDDGNPCTEDACDREAGGCVHAPTPGGCDDDNPCTVQDACDAGACVGTSISDSACDDGEVCTTDDRCVEGACQGDLNLCNDLNPCTQDFCDATHEEALKGTGCVHLAHEGACDDVNPCTADDACVDGECAGTPLPGKGCSDGNLCTEGDVCGDDGTCAGTTTKECDDGNPCTVDSCAPGGGCVFTPDVGAACDDGDKCTVDDACTDAGACEGGPKCTNPDQCIKTSCDAETGTCAEAPRSCDDQNPCTDDSCDPAAGCVFTPNTLSCDDVDPCTLDDVCDAGACVGTPKTCDPAGDTPCAANLCDSETGACAMTNLNGLPCDDGDACSTADACSGGACVGTAATCGDADPCTSDWCDPATGECVHDDLATCEDLAFERANEYRKLVGLPLLGNHQAIIDAATAHCAYYVAHKTEVYDGQGVSPHSELPGYDGFTGQSFGDRLTAAGYDAMPMFEVMAFVNDPVKAIDGWMSTVYHRIPFVVPNADEMGYGAAQGGLKKCDTVDFGSDGSPPPGYDDAITPFPPDGMTGVPTWWDGLESPTPPLPEGEMYPSGPILTVTFGHGGNAGVSIKSSTIQGPNGPVPHVAGDSTNDANLCCGVITLYPYAPIEPLTTYTVVVDYSRNGVPGAFEWSFTTGDGESQSFLP